jgi:hypothetical protein
LEKVAVFRKKSLEKVSRFVYALFQVRFRRVKHYVEKENGANPG